MYIKLDKSKIHNKDNYIKRGFEWIKTQQKKLGFWDAELFSYFSFPLITVLVLELERLIFSNAIIPKLII